MSQYNLALIQHEIDQQIVYQRADDGYVNATAMCTAAGKLFGDYYRLSATQSYLNELSGSMGMPMDLLVQKITTGPNEFRGTWVYPDIAVDLARWCSPKFAVQVNKFIREWMQGATSEQKELESWRHFHDRVDLTRSSVPHGHFSVFNEIAGMIVPMIKSGVKLDDHTVPDISVGKIWGKYWTDNDLSSSYGKRQHYPHEYPDYYPQNASGVQDAWCYPDSALGIFREWFRATYQEEKLPQYLSRKQRAGHIEPETVNKLIDTFSPKKLK